MEKPKQHLTLYNQYMLINPKPKAKLKSENTYILNKLDIKGSFLKIVKCTCEKPTANNVMNGNRLDAFPLRSQTR